jgi:CRISPR/Cas system CSM-associated protein Csm3 (group 7 of RAMP superfamily)
MNPSLTMHRLTIPLIFPSGLAPGAGKDLGNALLLARDGKGSPVLRGSSLAGALRHAWARTQGGLDTDPLEPDARIAERFGSPCAGEFGETLPSALKVDDILLDPGQTEARRRTHNSMDRHTGAVRSGGLFTIDALPPGTRGTARLLLMTDDDWAIPFLQELVGLFQNGLVLGGKGSRGVGLAILDGKAQHKEYDLSKVEDLGAWLDRSWKDRAPDTSPNAEGIELQPSNESEDLLVDITLAPRRGQDFCVGEGQGLEQDTEPQTIVCSDGELRYRIPGSSLRGSFRAWMTRLAARDPEFQATVSDSSKRFSSDGPASGDEIGWCFVEDGDRVRIQDRLDLDAHQLDSYVACPVTRLFGSLYAAGRIHISDSISSVKTSEDHEQVRYHVAIDRFTGGAQDGFLFTHRALHGDLNFPITIRIKDCEEHEARWLASTLSALNLGLLRLGSSKSSGVLEVRGPIRANGAHASILKELS